MRLVFFFLLLACEANKTTDSAVAVVADRDADGFSEDEDCDDNNAVTVTSSDHSVSDVSTDTSTDTSSDSSYSFKA